MFKDKYPCIFCKPKWAYTGMSPHENEATREWGYTRMRLRENEVTRDLSSELLVYSKRSVLFNLLILFRKKNERSSVNGNFETAGYRLALFPAVPQFSLRHVTLSVP